MKQTKHALKSSLAAAVAIACVSAVAVPVHFDIDGVGSSATLSNISNNTVASNPTTSLVSGLGNTVFDLSAGQSHTFDFFNLHVDDRGYGHPDNGGQITADIGVTLAFDDPDAGSASTGDVALNYSGNGGWWSGYDTFTSGSLIWDPVSNVSLADGTEFSIDLSDIGALTTGNNLVSATITLIEEGNRSNVSTSVPEPSTIALLGISALGLAGLGRRRRRLDD